MGHEEKPLAIDLESIIEIVLNIVTEDEGTAVQCCLLDMTQP